MLFYETLYRHFGCNLQDVQVLIKKSVYFKFLETPHNLTTYYLYITNYLLQITGIYCNLHCINRASEALPRSWDGMNWPPRWYPITQEEARVWPGVFNQFVHITLKYADLWNWISIQYFWYLFITHLLTTPPTAVYINTLSIALQYNSWRRTMWPKRSAHSLITYYVICSQVCPFPQPWYILITPKKFLVDML